MAKIVKLNGFEIKLSKKDIQDRVEVINNALENNENLQSTIFRAIYTNSVVNRVLFNQVFYHTTQYIEYDDSCVGYTVTNVGYTVTNVRLKSGRTIWQMAMALATICDELFTTYNDIKTANMILDGYCYSKHIHRQYRETLNKVILLDLICLAFVELASITIISSWSHSKAINKISKNHVDDITDIWFNWWLDYFIYLEIKTLKIRLGLLNRKLNKEIEFNECFTMYADDLANDRVIVLNRLMHLIK